MVLLRDVESIRINPGFCTFCSCATGGTVGAQAWTADGKIKPALAIRFLRGAQSVAGKSKRLNTNKLEQYR
jgi:hypothetical protein